MDGAGTSTEAEGWTAGGQSTERFMVDFHYSITFAPSHLITVKLALLTSSNKFQGVFMSSHLK